ncbi:urease accessory protein UreD [Nocardioides endophyticus]
MSTLTPDRRTTAPTGPQLTTISVRRTEDEGAVRVGLGASGGPGRPVIRPMLLAVDERRARVALVPDGALLLADDAVAIHIDVGPGAGLELIEPAGTVAYDMRGGRATWDVDVRLGQGATLTWAGEPFVVAAGALVRRTTTVQVADGATLALRETLVLGRSGEPAGQVRQRTAAVDEHGDPLLVEELALDADRAVMLLGGKRVVDTVMVLGARVPELAGTLGCHRFDLERSGTVLRRLADEAHRGLADAHWAAAVDTIAR